VVVVGGGVGGCSILYWLTRLGWDDVVLCERADLTSGSTFHSAGLVGQLRGSLSLTKMMMNSVELYRTLGDEVGLETGWHEVGSLRLASSQERMEELARPGPGRGGLRRRSHRTPVCGLAGVVGRRGAASEARDYRASLERLCV
jgi:glycine/D-amino acid oxidase-like deaminating enzyme